MTPEEKQAMVQFFGTIHAQGKQTDQMVVGSSKFITPISSGIKQQLSNLLATQTVQEPARQPINHLPPVQAVDVNTAVNELRNAEMGTPVHEASTIQRQPVLTITADPLVSLVEEIKNINSSLKEIVTILKKSNGTRKKTNNKE